MVGTGRCMDEPVIDLREEPGGVVVAVDGDVDGASAPALDSVLARAVDTRPAGSGDALVVDLSRLRFIDSTGMNCLVRAANKLRPEGSSLVVRGARPHVKRLFTIAGLQQVIDVA